MFRRWYSNAPDLFESLVCKGMVIGLPRSLSERVCTRTPRSDRPSEAGSTELGRQCECSHRDGVLVAALRRVPARPQQKHAHRAIALGGLSDADIVAGE